MFINSSFYNIYQTYIISNNANFHCSLISFTQARVILFFLFKHCFSNWFIKSLHQFYWCRTRAVRRRTGCRRQRWVVLWPAAATRRAFFIGGGGVALWSAAASDRLGEHWNSALAGQAFFPGFTGVSYFTCDIRWAAGAEKLTVNIHAVHNFTVGMS